MQQIERYGVIALLFLLVTIVVVALWDGGDPAQAKERNPDVTQRVDKTEPGKVAPDRRANPHTGQNAPTQGRVSLSTLEDPDAARRRSASTRTKPLEVGQPPVAPGLGAVANLMDSTGFSPEPRQNRGANRRYEGNSERTSRPVQGEPTADKNEPSSLPNTIRTNPPASQPPVPKVQSQPSPTRHAPVPVGTRTYTVAAGDSLERIARRELGDGNRWKEIQTLNGISNPGSIVVGAVLKLPAGQAPVQPVAGSQNVASKAPAVVKGAAGTYTVQPGDVLSRIAQKELGSAKRYTEIVALNPGLKPERLVVGQVLRMPAEGTPVTKKAPVPAEVPAGNRPKEVAKAKDNARYVVQ